MTIELRARRCNAPFSFGEKPMAIIRTIYHPETGEKGVKVEKLPTIKGYMDFYAYGKDAFLVIMKKWETVRSNRCRVIPFRLAHARQARVRVGHA